MAQTTTTRGTPADQRVLPQDVQGVSSAEIFGPFAQNAEISELLVDGYKVPHIVLFREEKPIDPNLPWTIVMDNRLRVQVSEAEITRWGPMLAQYGARCAGMTSHGPDSTWLNPHGPSGTLSPEEQQQKQSTRRF